MRTFHNTLLQALSSEILQRLDLRPVEFELNHEIEWPGSSIERLTFIEMGMASLTVSFDDGSQVEAGMFGFESVIGISALMGTKTSLNRVYTQLAGNGYTCPIANARAEFNRGADFQRLALNYVQAQLVHAIQSAGCNAKHSVEQRLARWLLTCRDRAGSDTFRMSQEFLADMVGVSRPTVSVIAAVLKEKGTLEYTRGVIRILDVEALERTSCECYLVIKHHLDNYAAYDSGIVLARPTVHELPERAPVSPGTAGGPAAGPARRSSSLGDRTKPIRHGVD